MVPTGTTILWRIGIYPDSLSNNALLAAARDDFHAKYPGIWIEEVINAGSFAFFAFTKHPVQS